MGVGLVLGVRPGVGGKKGVGRVLPSARTAYTYSHSSPCPNQPSCGELS